MTNGDKIRAMSDEELADMFTALMHRQRLEILGRLQEHGIIVHVVEMPMLTKAAHLEWLREPAEEANHAD